MSPRPAPPPAPLLDTIEEALDLLRSYQGSDGTALDPDPLPSLLAQCEALNLQADQTPPEPVRSLHHFACTGGTLIARAIAALPNTVLLSEIDPLSSQHLKSAPMNFCPTDLIGHLHLALREVPQDTIIGTFQAGLAHLGEDLASQGCYLVIRDHTHSHFCNDANPRARPTLRAMIARRMPVLSLVTVRHPLDSFLSLDRQGWGHFSPFTLEEYCTRYLAFLDAYEEVPQVRYEDFVEDPGGVLAEICDILRLPRSAIETEVMQIIKLSGDSGRRGGAIAPRPRRQIPEAVRAQIADSPAYDRLCSRNGYASEL